MTAKEKHIYPSHELEDALRERGFHVVCHWEEKRPKNTAIAWMHYLFASNGESAGGMIVQTFREGGWSVYVEPTKHLDRTTSSAPRCCWPTSPTTAVATATRISSR